MTYARKIAASFLAIMVLFFTVVGVLAVWDIIQVEDFMTKTLSTLLILFVASAVILFLFAVVFKGDDAMDRKHVNRGPRPNPAPGASQSQPQQ